MRLAAVLVILASAVAVEARPQIVVRKAVVVQEKVIVQEVIIPVIVERPTYSISFQPPATIIYGAPQYQPAPQPVYAPQPAPVQAPVPAQRQPDCCEALLAEIRALRADIAAARGQLATPQPTTFEQVIQVRCAECHDATQVEAKKSKIVLWKDGKLAELSVAEKRGMFKMVQTDKMPKDHAPLNAREKELFFKGIDASLGNP